ncbi:PQQ-binding-like beta-propeller repeat protein, partial [Opitutales bacterium]|nr:PQQ-binding-like beta-propeller repeat protein [Opitutales bacterium]
TGRTICHKKTCVAASTLASDGHLLIAQFSSNDVFCLDLLGNLRWLRGLTFDHPNIANGLGMSSSPLIVGENAIIQVENDADSFSFGLNLTDGTTSWKKERPRAANWTSPISLKYKGQEIVGLQSNEGLTAIDPKTGENLWAYQDGASTMSSSTWTKENILLIPSNGLTAIKLNSNMLEFQQIWRENKLKPGTGSPSSKDGKVYVVNNANVLTCASVQTGEIIWRLRLEGPISSSSVLGGHYLFVFSETGLGQIVDLRDESPRVIHSVNLDDTILCTPAVSKDSIIVRSDAKLWKLEGI